MYSAIGRMKRLDIIEVIGNSPHLDHALSVVGRQALDLGPPLHTVSARVQFGKGLESPTYSGTRPGPAEDLVQESPSIIAPGALHLGVVAWRIRS